MNMYNVPMEKPLPELSDRYQLSENSENPLGKGFFGSVYPATDTKLKRPVAIKVVDSNTLPNEFKLNDQDMVLREASFPDLVDLPSARVMEVYEVIITEGNTHYIVFELLNTAYWTNLSEAIEQRMMTLDQVI